MPLSKRAIENLKVIYRNDYGEDLTDEEAWEMGNRLLRLFAVLMRLPAKPSETDEKGSNPVSFPD